MKLVVTTEARMVECGGKIYSCETIWSRYLVTFSKVIVVGRVKHVENVPEEMTRIDSEKIAVHPVEHYHGPIEYLRCFRKVKADIRRVVGLGDAFMLRAPGQIAAILGKILHKQYRVFGVEVVADPWDVLAPGVCQYPFLPVLRHITTHSLKKLCHSAFVVSYVTENTLQKRYPAREGAYTTNYSSVELEDEMIVGCNFERLARIESVESRLMGDGPPVRLGFLGRMSQMYKAPDVHIKATVDCRRKGLNVELVLAGGGQHLKAMVQLTKDLNAESYVHFLGGVPGGQPVFTFLDSVDLFLICSRTEGLPRALIEAMARGCPAIGTDVGGIPELLDKDSLVPVDDVAALADRISSFLKSQKVLHENSLRNGKKAEGYSKSELTRRRRECYDRLARLTLLQ